MTRSPCRRTAALLAGAVVGAGLLLSGCSAGQIAETARKNPSVQGVNADAQVREDGQVGRVSVREVAVPYDSPEGYARDADAPLEARIFNDTTRAVTVRVRPGAPAGASDGAAEVVQAKSVALVGATAASPSASAADGAQAQVEIPAGGFVVLARSTGTYLRLTGLSDRLGAGMSVPLVFQFSNGAEIQVNAPIGPPTREVPRATAEPAEEGEGH